MNKMMISIKIPIKREIMVVSSFIIPPSVFGIFYSHSWKDVKRRGFITIILPSFSIYICCPWIPARCKLIVETIWLCSMMRGLKLKV